MTPGQLTIINDGNGNTFVYQGVPGAGSLVAYHVPVSAYGGTDPFGNGYVQGDWCAEGYRLVPLIEVWPGMILMAAPSAGAQ